jgi:hypothetical protein
VRGGAGEEVTIEELGVCRTVGADQQLCIRAHQLSLRRAAAACEQRVSVRQHTSAYVGRRQHTSAYVSMRERIRQHTSAYVSTCQHTSACASIRQHAPAYVSIRQHNARMLVPTCAQAERHTRALLLSGSALSNAGTSRALSACRRHLAYVSMRQRTSAYVSILQHASAYVSIRQHTSAYE